MRLLALLLVFCLFLSAEDEEYGYSDTPEVAQKILYSSFEKLPESLFKGELFSITLKTLSTEEYFERIAYRFNRGVGVRLVNELPIERREGPYYYHTFYFVATGDYVRIPDVTVALVFSDFHQSDLAYLAGKSIDVIALNPPSDFSQVIADGFTIEQYKANHYDDTHYIVLFDALVTRGAVDAFTITQATKQGFESNSSGIDESRFTYYAIIPKRLEQLEFTFFDRAKERFEKRIVPIIVDDDSVSTQSDLKPRDHRHMQTKLFIALGVAGAALLLALIRRRFIYLLLTLVAGGYAMTIAVPIEHVCVKAQRPIYLLPMRGSTVFETTQMQTRFEREGAVKGYVKIKLDNNQIGWIREDDLCTP